MHRKALEPSEWRLYALATSIHSYHFQVRDEMVNSRSELSVRVSPRDISHLRSHIVPMRKYPPRFMPPMSESNHNHDPGARRRFSLIGYKYSLLTCGMPITHPPFGTFATPIDS